ncbi:MAG: exodeoxyribonuclease VII small subunit [Leptolyngbyaceae cyanobacterium]
MTSSAQLPIPQDNQQDNQPEQAQATGVPVPLPAAVTPSHSVSMEDLPSDWQYESAVARVEAIIAQIEAGNLELADIFEQFGMAVKHLQDCEAFLSHHRQQVDILVETLADESKSNG